jgi:hypothetical protein
LRLVVGTLDGFLEADGVDNGGRGSNVDDLHHRVVDRIKGRKEVQVTRDEDDEEKFV